MQVEVDLDLLEVVFDGDEHHDEEPDLRVEIFAELLRRHLDVSLRLDVVDGHDRVV